MRPEPGFISVAIPARNEEKYLPATLAALIRARAFLAGKGGRLLEILVVDNDSTDQTAQIASASGARVIHEPEHNIAAVRNAGAKAASGEVLVFLDADTLVPESFLWRGQQSPGLREGKVVRRNQVQARPSGGIRRGEGGGAEAPDVRVRQ